MLGPTKDVIQFESGQREALFLGESRTFKSKLLKSELRGTEFRFLFDTLPRIEGTSHPEETFNSTLQTYEVKEEDDEI